MVRACIRDGLTAALVGSSGAGKSTLVNALLGEERMPTGEVRERDGCGCHVTTYRELFLCPEAASCSTRRACASCNLSTKMASTRSSRTSPLSARCRYRDCRHDTEPGCAVKGGDGSGELEAERLEHYRKLEREAQAYQLRHDETAATGRAGLG